MSEWVGEHSSVSACVRVRVRLAEMELERTQGNSSFEGFEGLGPRVSSRLSLRRSDVSM